MTTETKVDENSWAYGLGKTYYETIADMVACLQADRDRLEVLRDERDGFDEDGKEWATENPDEASELAELESAVKLDGPGHDDLSEDDARDRITEDALSLRIFGEYTDGKWEADNYELLLCTGGPAVRIVGDINQYGEASSARLEVQDWFKPWTEYHQADQDVLLAYAQCFYFATE